MEDEKCYTPQKHSLRDFFLFFFNAIVSPAHNYVAVSFFFSSSSSLPSFYLFSFSLSFSHSSSTLFPPFSFFFFFFFSSFSPYILLRPLFPPPPYSYGFYLNVIISMKITFCQKYILLSLFNFCCSVTQSCPTLCDTMDCCTIAFTVL